MNATLNHPSIAALSRQLATARHRPSGGRFLDLGPIVVEAPAQVILYQKPGPEVIEGVAQINPDGEAQITVPIESVPLTGTPVQIVIYGPRDMVPLVIEGTTAPDPGDGSLPIQVQIPRVPQP